MWASEQWETHTKSQRLVVIKAHEGTRVVKPGCCVCSGRASFAPASCACSGVPAVPGWPGSFLYEAPASAASDSTTLLPDPVTPAWRFSDPARRVFVLWSSPTSLLLGDESDLGDTPVSRFGTPRIPWKLERRSTDLPRVCWLDLLGASWAKLGYGLAPAGRSPAGVMASEASGGGSVTEEKCGSRRTAHPSHPNRFAFHNSSGPIR